MEQKKLRILAVEDNPADFRLLEEYLKEGLSKNFELVRAETIKEALKLLPDEKLDIVFLDLGLPDSMGLDGIERLSHADPNLPVIVLTGLDDEKTGIFALSKNAQDYLVKGKIESKSLVKSIRFAIERKHVEEILKNSEEKLKAIFESSPAGIILVGINGKILEANKAAIVMNGAASKKELIGKQCFSFIDKPYHKKAKQAWKKALARSGVTEVELSLLTKDKRRIDALLSATLLRGNEGEPNAFLIVVNDITLLKAASDAIKKVNEELEVRVKQRTLELNKTVKLLNKELVVRIKTEKYIRITNALLKLADRSRDKKEYIKVVLKLMKSWANCECAGIRLIDDDRRIPYEAHIGYSHSFMDSENSLSLTQHKCACIRVITGKYLACDKDITTKKGSFFLNDALKFVARLPRKYKNNFRGVCMNEGFQSMAVIPIRYKNTPIAAMHLADKRMNVFLPDRVEFFESLMPLVGEGIQKFMLSEKVDKSSELLEKIFATTNFMVAYLDKDFNFIRVNNAYALADSKTPEFFAGKNIFALYPDQENEKIFKRVIEKGASDSMLARPFLYEKNYEHGVAYCDWSLQPVKDNSGKVEGVILFLVDITKRKQAEEELLKTQRELNDAKRLSDIGTLAATVAHELRNPLAAMRMAAYNIRAKRTNPDLDKHITNIEKKIVESDQIINNLLFYSRLKISSYQRIKIKDILEECMSHIRLQSEKNSIELHAFVTDIVIEADPLQMSELFHNLLNNAYDALVLKERQRKIEITADIFNESFLKVVINDNGVGISKESLKRMYEPFFTTKAKGTGLGLTVCYQIVNLHKGKIDIESEENKGTTVTVIIPLAQ